MQDPMWAQVVMLLTRLNEEQIQELGGFKFVSPGTMTRSFTSPTPPDGSFMSRKQSLYVGRAGQMAVMAELLWRGLNVAFPEVDVGDDVFVVKDETGELWRVQVKTATAGPLPDGYSAQFSISLEPAREPAHS